MNRVSTLNLNVWNAFQDFIYSLDEPSKSADLEVSCSKVLSLLQSSIQMKKVDEVSEVLNQDYQTLFKLHGEGYQLTNLLRLYEVFFPRPIFAMTLDIFQLFEKEVDVNFLQMIWSMTAFDQVIILGKTQLTLSEFQGEGLRLKFEKEESKPLGIHLLDSFQLAKFLQERIQTYPSEKVLLIQPTNSEEKEKQLSQLVKILYRTLRKFYFPDKTLLRFPLTAENFLFYVFYVGFEQVTDASLWSLLLEYDLGQCTNIIQSYH